MTCGRSVRRWRLRELMDRRGLEALVLGRPANFAWYTNGADNRVDHSSSFGVAAILLTPEGECVLTDNIEASRIEEEQTPDMEVVEYPWHEDRTGAIKKLAGRTSVGADLRATDFRDVSDLVASLCHLLDPDALERYPKVGADASAALSEAAGALEPGTSEIEAAAKLIEACRQRGLFVPVALVGARGGSPATVTLLRPPPLWVGGR